MKELPTYPQVMIYTCQDNAWVDERVMLLWVEQVLKPYVIKAPLLFLNYFQCHMMGSVVESIQELRGQIGYLLGGCMVLFETFGD